MPTLSDVAISLCPPLKRLQQEVRSLRHRSAELEGSFIPDNGHDLPPDFRDLPFASRALAKVLSEYEFSTVLDLGSGAGTHAGLSFCPEAQEETHASRLGRLRTNCARRKKRGQRQECVAAVHGAQP